MFDTIFWDNDGILVRTEEYYYQANREVLGSVGVDLDLATYCRISLLRGESVLDLAPVTAEQREAMGLRRNELYASLLETGDILMPGVDEVLRKLHGKISMAIVSSSRRSHFEICHARTGLLPFFDFILTREDFQRSKPHPEPYLRALARGRVDPSRCLVIEDTPRGLLSARRAGLRCAVLPNPVLGKPAFPGAFRLLKNIPEILELFPGKG
jgi:HAD superfamily hydrolase (TIGR01509 family)